MTQADVIQFFDRAAPTWDEEMVFTPSVAKKILDAARVIPGKTVLDVACGTGILIPRYLDRGAASVTAIDISPQMTRLCAEKFPHPPVEVLCGDAETYPFAQTFDCVMVYNAFPHFPDPERLIHRLSALVSPGGTLTIAHGMPRTEIDRRHEGPARHVSRALLPLEDLQNLMARDLTITTAISDDTMYQVTGIRL